MRKVSALLFVFLFFAGVSFAAGEVNVKLGLDPVGNFDAKLDLGEDASESFKFGFNLSAEYLYPVHEIVRVGAGLEYLFPREVDVEESPKFSWLPVYATVLVNPITPVPELYFKGNIGYTVLFDVSNADDLANEKGGLYWALGAGYEFDFGLVLEAMYGFYYSSYDITYAGQTVGTVDITHSKLGINIGYKFKL
ncbi:MAG: outer membrane beta-barrel protein [Endomicrobium sp.]|jgi:hypothetical protein|nr:outer membrane beta-barrel protein [Endomicrobium sp.]